MYKDSTALQYDALIADLSGIRSDLSRISSSLDNSSDSRRYKENISSACREIDALISKIHADMSAYNGTDAMGSESVLGGFGRSISSAFEQSALRHGVSPKTIAFGKAVAGAASQKARNRCGSMDFASLFGKGWR